MRKVLIGILFIFITISPAYSETGVKLNVKSNSFMDLGRYIETLEINDETQTMEEPLENVNVKNFEEEAILDVAKRYEENAIELNLEDNSDIALENINSERLFKLEINENHYTIEQKIKSENMIWDGSKSFSQAFLGDRRSTMPMPGLINSAKISTSLDDELSADIGQTYLFNSNGRSVLFIRANESMYNTGSVVNYKGDSLNLSVGSFSTSYNQLSSGGAILSSNAINLPRNAGNFVLGGAFFSNSLQEDNKTTSGGFLEYEYKRLKLNAQVGQSRYKNSADVDTSLYFIPEFKITDSISFKTRFIRNITRDTMQDELALTYKPKKSKRNFEFEINASNQYTETNNLRQKIKLTTSFRI